MRFELNWELNVSFPWWEKIHDFVWEEQEDDADE